MFLKQIPGAFLIMLQMSMASSVSQTSKQSVFFVSQPEAASWQDFAYLAAVPASRMVQKGNGAVISLDEGGNIPLEVVDYLRRLKPQTSYYLGTKPLAAVPETGKLVQIPYGSAEQAAVVLANRFWETSQRAVLCQKDDYASALMASTLAARLRVPLYFSNSQGLSPETTASIDRIKAKELIFIGKAPANLTVTSLPDVTSVMKWLKQQKLTTSYLALVNVRDRTQTKIRKLSLVAPVLAAARGGMVYPFDEEVMWRTPFAGNPITGELPKGIPNLTNPPPRAGVIELTEGKIPYVLCSEIDNKNRRLFLDLNGDGKYEGSGEGPISSDGSLQLLGKKRFVNFLETHGKKCDGFISSGRAEDFAEKLRKFYLSTQIPQYVCIVGLPDSIPQAIMNHGRGDMTSDLPYANTDDDLFSEISVGRIIAENLTFASLHVSRTITYHALQDASWASKAGQARWENTLGSYFENAGLTASAYHSTQDLAWLEKPSEDGKKKGRRAPSFGQDSTLCQTGFIAHASHSSAHSLGETYDADSTSLLAPAVVESGGCSTCNLDYDPIFKSVISRMFRNGSISFCGQTNLGIAHQEQQRIEFWNGIMTGMSLGDAHRRAQNSKASLVIETEQTKGGPDYYQLNIRSLFGDPAFKPYIPKSLLSEAAKSSLNESILTVKGPKKWEVVKIFVPEDWKMWADKSLYTLRGIGSFPTAVWCKEGYNKEDYFVTAEVTTSLKIKSIIQKQEVAAPLGWNGKYTVDENSNGTRTYRWRVRLVDFNQIEGTFINRKDQIEYELQPEP